MRRYLWALCMRGLALIFQKILQIQPMPMPSLGIFYLVKCEECSGMYDSSKNKNHDKEECDLYKVRGIMES